MAHPPQRGLDQFSRLLFVFSLCLVSLLYGLASARYAIFPYPQLLAAESALTELFGGKDSQPLSLDRLKPASNLEIQRASDRDDGALILMSGGYRVLNEYHPEGCMAWLMDRDGEIKHVWKHQPHLWHNLVQEGKIGSVEEVRPFGIELLEDGGLIVTFHSVLSWPFALSIARFDVDSNLVWKLDCHAHHWFSITPDGKIITPTLRVLDAPKRVGQTVTILEGFEGRLMEDCIAVISLDGEILEEKSVLSAVEKSGLVGLINAYQPGKTDFLVQSASIPTDDPLHLNDVRLVDETVADLYGWQPGDWLVSFRNTNTIAVLDHASTEVKWMSMGKTIRQHSPRFIGDQAILAFDNLGGKQREGAARVVQIDIRNGDATTLFPTERQRSELPVRSVMCGHLDLSRNEDSLLIAVAEQSRVLEFDLDRGEVTWECRLPGAPYQSNTAKFAYDVSFELNQ